MTEINPDAPQRFYFANGAAFECMDTPASSNAERLYLFIRDFIEQKGWSPSFNEIRAGLRFANNRGGLRISSKSVIHRYQAQLINLGLIERNRYKGRGIVVTR